MQMAANNRGGMRPQGAGKTPSFIVIGLLVVIAILGFNYWNVSSKNSVLVSELAEMSEHMRLTSVKKLAVEKRNDALLQKVRENEHELDKQKSVAQRKEDEVNNLNSQLDSRKSECDTQQQELNRVRQEYDVCNSNSQDLETKLDQANEAKSNCEVKVATDKEECDKRVQAAAANQATPQQDCTEQVKTSQQSLLNIIHKLWGNKAIIVLQDAGIDVSGIQLNTDGGGQLPSGGRDQKTAETQSQQAQQQQLNQDNAQGQQQQQGQVQYPAQGETQGQGQYPQQVQGNTQGQGQYPQQGQGQYQQQGQGQFQQNPSLNQQQQGSFQAANQQEAYPVVNQQAAADGQQAVPAGQYNSSQNSAANVYHEENNYPSKLSNKTQSRVGNVRQIVTTRAPRYKDAQQEQVDKYDTGYPRRQTGEQSQGSHHSNNTFNSHSGFNNQQTNTNNLGQQSSNNQNNENKPFEYSRKEFERIENRSRPSSTQNPDQRFAPGPKYDNQNDQAKRGPGHVAGEAGVQQDQQQQSWQQHQQDNQQAMGQQPVDGSPGQIGQVQAPVDRSAYNQQQESQAQGQIQPAATPAGGQQGGVQADQGQLGVQPAGAGGPDAPADKEQVQAPESRVVPVAPDQHQAPQGQEGALQPPPQDGVAGAPPAGADSNAANEQDSRAQGGNLQFKPNNQGEVRENDGRIDGAVEGRRFGQI